MALPFRRRIAHHTALNFQPGILTMMASIKLLALAVYIAAGASLLVPLPLGAGPLLQLLALVLLAAHTLEVVVYWRWVRAWEGPLAASIALTLLFGLAHWLPLRERARRNGDTA